MESHCEILWEENQGAHLVRHPKSDYVAGLNYAHKHRIIGQQSLRSNMLILWIIKPLTTGVKRKMRAYMSPYAFNIQYDVSKIFFAIVKIVRPDKCEGLSDTKTNLKTMNFYQLNHEIPKGNLHIL